jgi:hypothetical protein
MTMANLNILIIRYQQLNIEIRYFLGSQYADPVWITDMVLQIINPNASGMAQGS